MICVTALSSLHSPFLSLLPLFWELPSLSYFGCVDYKTLHPTGSSRLKPNPNFFNYPSGGDGVGKDGRVPDSLLKQAMVALGGTSVSRARGKKTSVDTSLSTSPSRASSKVHCVCPLSEDSGCMVECEVCSCWSHCKCVGLTVALAPSFPFVCPYCVKSLFARVSALSSEVSALQAQVSSITVPAVTLDDQSPLSTEVQRVSASLVQLTTSMEALQAKCGSQSSLQVGDHPSQDVQTSGPPTYPKVKVTQQNPDRRYNIIVSDIKENPVGTVRSARVACDMAEVTSLLSPLLPALNESTIRDCYRLGKFSPERCHPLLVALNRTCDVSTALSNKHMLADQPHIKVNADLSVSDCNPRSILLRKRYELTSFGVDRHSIRLRYNSSGWRQEIWFHC